MQVSHLTSISYSNCTPWFAYVVIISLLPNVIVLFPKITSYIERKLSIGRDSHMPQHINIAEVELRNYLRMLWEQHVFWTRLTISGIVFKLPDAEFTTNRLLRNPKDFEKALVPFYGSAIASQFEKLFTDHLVIAAQLVQAAKDGNSAAAAEAEKKWYVNANEIATFLGRINPYWSVDNWQSMMHEHLTLTKTEAIDMLTKEYANSISIFNQIELQALNMADIMAYGIARQFSSQFPM